MTVRIVKTSIVEIRKNRSGKLYNFLYSNAMQLGGAFKSLLTYGGYPHTTTPVWIYEDKGIIKGWSFVYTDQPECREIGVWVLSKYRRQGIGSILRDRALADTSGELYCVPWSKEGARLYQIPKSHTEGQTEAMGIAPVRVRQHRRRR